MSATESPRPKRRAAKVDYTEKKPEDYEKRERELMKQKEKEQKEKEKEKEKEKRKKSSTPEDETKVLNLQPKYTDAKHPFPELFDLSGAMVHEGLELVLKNGERLVKGDNVLLVCEPPGEPYYVGRIMGFVKKNGKQDDVEGTYPAELFLFKINWWYRSRDISKHSLDSRVLYASMHSDTCPLQSFRGRCVVKHRDEIKDLDAFKLIPNQFWFEKLFDRYMIKFYDVIPTVMLTNLPQSYSKALNKRFEYIFVEQGRSKEMFESPKSCVKCNQWCSPTDSVQCCECDDLYHLLCLDPPIFKKPARGFAWSCIKCVKKLEQKKMIPNTEISYTTEEQGEVGEHHDPPKLPIYEELAISFLEKDKGTSFQQRRNKEEWIYRYLGMHARFEDALDIEDRPYPRAASRLGPKHQLTGMQPWYNHQIVYYDSSELSEVFQSSQSNAQKKKKTDGRKKKNPKGLEEEKQRALGIPQEFKETSPEEFPQWLQPRPVGYIERGGNDTVTLMWREPEDEGMQEKVEQYIKESAPIAESLSLLANTPNFMDTILKNLLDSNFDFDKAMKLNQKLTRESLREPTFTAKEIQKFENGIRKYGSELWPTYKEVKTQSFAMIVRFYYLWKKTKNGHLIWDNFEGRKKYKSKPADSDKKEQDLANSGDDSSYDAKKSSKIQFQCKHCHTNESTQWFRTYGLQHLESNPNIVQALCKRCARLWRRYAVVWEDPAEVMRRINMKAGNWKKRIESELVMDAEMILKMSKEIPPVSTKKRKSSSDDSNGVKSKKLTPSPHAETPIKKKKASVTEEDTPKEQPLTEIVPVVNDSYGGNLQQILVEYLYLYTSPQHNGHLKYKEFPSHKSSQHSQVSSVPRPTKTSISVITQCGLCGSSADYSSALHCQSCDLSVHPSCYGINTEQMDFGLYKWFCDTCSNSLNPIVSTDYECIFCHGDGGSSPLKRTMNGKWAHILCSIFIDDVKFGDVDSLQPVVGCEKFIKDQVEKGIYEFKLHCEQCSKAVDVPFSDEFKVGFILQDDAKPDSKSVKVGSASGKLKPVIFCSDHQLPKSFITLNGEVKRVKQSGMVNALRVFLDDTKKDISGVSGSQRRFYYLNRAMGEHSETQVNAVEVPHYECKNCGASKTVKWEMVGGEPVCYSCHVHKADDVVMDGSSDEGVDLLEISSEPLDASLYGIGNVDERLERPKKPEAQVVKTETIPQLPQLHTFTNENLPPKAIENDTDGSKEANGKSTTEQLQASVTHTVDLAVNER
jgi:hypothetical protein